MADYDIDEIVRRVKAELLAESQGVGEIPVVSSLDGINSLPSLRDGSEVVEAPIVLLRQPAEEAAARANEAADNAQDTADHPTCIGEDNYVYKWNKTAQAYDKTSIYVRGEAFSIKNVYSSIDAMLADKSTEFKEGDFCLINTGDVDNPDNAKLYVRSAVGSWDFLVDMSGAIGFTGKTPQMFIGTVSIGSGKDSAAVTVTPDGTDTDGNPKYRLNYVIPCLVYEDLTPEQIAELQRPANEMIAVLQATDSQVKANESNRQVKEEERQSNESARQANEKARITNEDGRNATESTRQSNENIRQTNESTRMTQETSRQQSEQLRVVDYAALRKDIVSATENANAAADEARHLPEIQDGTWWVYDIALGEYVDTGSPATSPSPKIIDGIWWTWDDSIGDYVSTGWAVNSDFELTKENIESVFTGNIKTHTHEFLRYSAHVYEETPDFANLSTWTDEQGEHPYLIGNGIYVRNETEPTGYAFYMLSLSLEGSTWVRIPQIPVGYRMILTKEA